MSEKYSIGDEYLNCEQVNVSIGILLPTSAFIKPFNFCVGKQNFQVMHIESTIIQVSFKREAPMDLVNDFKSKKPNIGQYIIGYVSYIFPFLNTEIGKQKYNEAHFLPRSYSVFDIIKVIVFQEESKPVIEIFPKSINSFPTIKEYPNDLSEKIYVKDLVDSVYCYFYCQYDECIRKIITSIENYFINRKYEAKMKFVPKVKKIIKECKCSYANNKLAREVITSNIIEIYKTRNKIVHDKYRLSTNELSFVLKSIGTIFYFYKMTSGSVMFNSYILDLEKQFDLIRHYSQGVNLDDCLERSKNARETPIFKWESYEFDTFWFNGMRIRT